jgi:hypothetical protein
MEEKFSKEIEIMKIPKKLKWKPQLITNKKHRVLPADKIKQKKE